MRQDPTFTDSDLLRFWCLNLSNDERRDFLATLLWAQANCDVAKNVVLLILGIVADLVPFPGIRFVINLLLKLIPVGERISEVFIQETALRVIKEAGLDASQVVFRACNAVLSAEKE